MVEQETSPLTVLVYADDPAVRERVRMALGRRPAHDLPEVEYVEVATGPMVLREVESGAIDLCVLDGEAWPTGGMGLSRQLRDEIDPCPPVVVLLGRADDRWLATWSGAEATAMHPVDPLELTARVTELLRARVAAA
jgi:DNA-binding response OmpR family regulator